MESRIRLSQLFFIVSACAAISHTLSMRCVCEGAEPVRSETTWPPIVLAVIRNGERLKSGQYVATGKLSTETLQLTARGIPAGPPQVETFEETIEADFDFDADLNSFRHRRVRTSEPVPKQDTESHRWYVRSKTEVVELRGDGKGNRIFIYPLLSWQEIWPDEYRAFRPQPIVDPRMWGWPGWIEACYPFEEYINKALPKYDFKVSDSGEGIFHLEGEAAVPDSESKVILNWWCDEKQGLQPVRVSWGWKHPNRSKAGNPAYESEQSWEQHGDVWVIKSFSNKFKSGSSTHALNMAFDWSSVNHPVPGEKFDWKSWDFPKDYQEVWKGGLRETLPINITPRQ